MNSVNFNLKLLLYNNAIVYKVCIGSTTLRHSASQAIIARSLSHATKLAQFITFNM